MKLSECLARFLYEEILNEEKIINYCSVSKHCKNSIKDSKLNSRKKFKQNKSFINLESRCKTKKVDQDIKNAIKCKPRALKLRRKSSKFQASNFKVLLKA